MKKIIKKIIPSSLFNIFIKVFTVYKESFLSRNKFFQGNFLKFYSQCDEDFILLKKYLNYNNGFFIELGAMDGVKYSNTKFFEDNLQWSGILIEPTIQYNDLLLNRPNAFNFNYAISKIKGEVEFVGDGNVAGILNSMPMSHSQKWKLNTENSYFAPSVPISDIIDMVSQKMPKRKIEKIDFFSIDVEGGELEVLQTFDWSIPCFIILIELDGQNENKDQMCRDLLIEKGYKYEFNISVSEVWKSM